MPQNCRYWALALLDAFTKYAGSAKILHRAEALLIGLSNARSILSDYEMAALFL